MVDLYTNMLGSLTLSLIRKVRIWRIVYRRPRKPSMVADFCRYLAFFFFFFFVFFLLKGEMATERQQDIEIATTRYRDSDRATDRQHERAIYSDRAWSLTKNSNLFYNRKYSRCQLSCQMFCQQLLWAKQIFWKHLMPLKKSCVPHSEKNILTPTKVIAPLHPPSPS